jgi:hypothetical protein
MENNDPADRAQWAKLPTLSQLTAKRKSTLMDTTRPNQFHDDDDRWTSGLITPPNSQDATKMLISPPPEEVLRSGLGRVSLRFVRCAL